MGAGALSSFDAVRSICLVGSAPSADGARRPIVLNFKPLLNILLFLPVGLFLYIIRISSHFGGEIAPDTCYLYRDRIYRWYVESEADAIKSIPEK